MSRLALSFAVVLVTCAVLRADDAPATLEIGKPVPPLAGGEWAQGTPVTALPVGRVSVLAFWSSKSLRGPLEADRLNSLYLRHGSNTGAVTVIGQNVRENDPAQFTANLTAADVGVKFPVRLDDASNGADGIMAKTWLPADAQLPCAVVVDQKGVAVWCGPWRHCPGVVGKVIAGTFDPATHLQQLAEADALAEQIKPSLAANAFDGVLDHLSKIEALRGEPDFFTTSNRFRVLLKTDNYDAAYRFAADVEHDPATGMTAAHTFNELALIITDTKDLAERDLITAKRFARRAMELGNNWPGYANTLARAYFVNGEYKKAVEAETDAVSRAPDRLKAQLEKTLAKY